MRSALFSFAACLCLAASMGVANSLERSVKIIESLPDPSTVDAGKEKPPQVVPETDTRTENAGLALEVLPGTEIDIGTPMTFRVTSQKQGYLVLVDVDSNGKLSQIYPNPTSLAGAKGKDEFGNLLKKGQSRSIPDPSTKPQFQLVASLPTGVGMVVAILSDKPVKSVDLPDVPTALAGQLSAADFVQEKTRALKIMPVDEKAITEPPKWTFTTKFYAIK